jgi:hypothetical protein
MSYGSAGFPDGFVANMKWRFDGNIPDKVWKQFRTKFAKEHAKGWHVKKLFRPWRSGGEVVVSFKTTDPNVAREIASDQWEFLKATLSLLAVKEP